MKILVLDNYDSFVYNLVHIIREEGFTPVVMRNDALSIDMADRFDKILLSPGPGIPSEAGLMPEIIKRAAPKTSILGVCLGHQAIAEAYGGNLINMAEPLHGVSSKCKKIDSDELLFTKIPETFKVGRYHSWTVVESSLPSDLVVTARDEEGEILALRHKLHRVHGVQFHPESILTEHGKQLIHNWLYFC